MATPSVNGSVPDLERLTYHHLLSSVFNDRLEILNDPQHPSSTGDYSAEHALGTLLARHTALRTLRSTVKGYLTSPSSSHDQLNSLLQKWLSSPTKLTSDEFALLQQLVSASGIKELEQAKRAIKHFSTPYKSTWIIGSDRWAYDIGASGLQQALSAGAPINLLIVDEVAVEEHEGDQDRLKEEQKQRAISNGSDAPHPAPQTNGINGHSEASGSDQSRRTSGKKDLGLYAMNYNNAYVGSIAMYGDYAQACRALVEADQYTSAQLASSAAPIGPAVVLGLLPKLSTPIAAGDRLPALTLVRLTQRLTATSTWPLYRWTPDLSPTSALPSHKPGETFSLDSPSTKATLDAFLSRRNHLTLLSATEPTIPSVSPSFSSTLPTAHLSRAKKAFDLLSSSLSGPPLLIAYASDGGAAEKFAKRLLASAKARGVQTRLTVFDDTTLEDIAKEDHVLFVTSTAGQGEFPQNGRDLWKALVKAPAPGGAGGAPEGGAGSTLDKVKYAVFAMGDSHYWPRPEDAHYYNKSGKDLDKRLAELGAERLADIGLGNDQDADGPTTGLKEFEPRLWKGLGVDNVVVEEAEGVQEEPISNEHIKISSNYLRGTIAWGLTDKSTGALAESDGQLTKFHGIYQQDDRDIREQRKAEGLEPAFSFMVRIRMAAGVCKPEQWLAVDEISDRRGNGTFKLTTRQTFQFHGIVKGNLKPAIQEINKALLDTIAACGDVNRNVQCSANPGNSALHAEVYKFAQELSDHHLPKTNAYAEIWLDKKLVAGEAVQDFEPMYGAYYLPRKFKMAVAIPPSNDVDVFTNDVGFIAIIEEDASSRETDGKRVVGYNVSVGGGMGVTHSNKKTYPRLGSIIGFVTPQQALKVATAIIEVQRDNGDRTNRKHARLKYTVDDMGVDRFRAEVEKYAGFTLAPARDYTFTHNTDDFGWSAPDPITGVSHFTMFIENGRVADEEGKPFKTGLRELARVHKGVFRLTANQHLIVADVAPDDRATVESVLKKYGMDNLQFSGLRLSSSACVAFPTCGLAMAESERYLPELVTKVEGILEENGLRHDSIVMRMTGCPNGCARPWAAEIAFVGKAPGSYLMLLGGGFYGQRLNKIYQEAVNEQEIMEILRPMLKRYALERLEGEKFGDWTIRAGFTKAVPEGKQWYD